MKCDCGYDMEKIAESWTDSNGNRYVSYRCPHCGKVVKVRV